MAVDVTFRLDKPCHQTGTAMHTSLFLPPVYDAHGATQRVVTHLQRVDPHAQTIAPTNIMLALECPLSSLQSRVGASNVGLRYLERRVLPYFQRSSTQFHRLGVAGAQVGYGTQRSLIVMVLIQRVYQSHLGYGLVIGRWLARNDANKRENKCYIFVHAHKVNEKQRAKAP